MNHGRIYTILIGLYIGGILTANAMAAKLLQIGPMTVTTGLIGIPLVYLTRDFLNELYGEREVIRVVWAGFVADLVLIALTSLAIMMPASQLGASQENFAAIFGQTPRIVLGSMTAYLVCAYVDVRVFNMIRERTGARLFWLRKNVSTAVSQAIDSAIFVAIAFGGSVPWKALVMMGVGQYCAKMVWSPLGTPFSIYLLRRSGLRRTL